MGKKRVCVIGAGASGLTAIKCCIDEGLEPVCYEKSHDIGGLWRFEESTKDGATVYRSTYINTSKELMAYSDFPPPQAANYLHNSKVMQYYRDYADKFNLLKNIKYKREVLSCEKTADFELTGNWFVTTKNLLTDETSVDVFNGVMVAVGHHALPHFPVSHFPGADKFKGKILHSHDYRDFRGFENKNVVVLGVGNSGGDIAVELSWHSKQVYLSTRRGTWVFNRVGPYGMPIDFLVTTRAFLNWIMPSSIIRKAVESQLNEKFDHDHYGLRPDNGPFNQHPFVNDELPNRIINGSVMIKSNIGCFTEDSVIFDDGTEVEADAVIFATGFIFQFPFLDDSIAQVNGTESQLYKYMWPVGMTKHTLAVIGHVQVLGAVNPVSEMQSRWATRYGVCISGLATLPNDNKMLLDINRNKVSLQKRFYNSQRHTMEADHVAYMDEIADQIGVKPNMFSLFITDRKLARKVWYEFCSGYQYRLKGPGKWAGAREAIMGQKSRMFCPLHTRATTKSSKSKKKSLLSYYWLVAVAIGAFYV
uniref:Flavin-containing monooxygenase n=1 Tax=Ciona savignyi TaxID=51511 RepID=H2ZGS6_CIOSA